MPKISELRFLNTPDARLSFALLSLVRLELRVTWRLKLDERGRPQGREGNEGVRVRLSFASRLEPAQTEPPTPIPTVVAEPE